MVKLQLVNIGDYGILVDVNNIPTTFVTIVSEINTIIDEQYELVERVTSDDRVVTVESYLALLEDRRDKIKASQPPEEVLRLESVIRRYESVTRQLLDEARNTDTHGSYFIGELSMDDTEASVKISSKFKEVSDRIAKNTGLKKGVVVNMIFARGLLGDSVAKDVIGEDVFDMIIKEIEEGN